MVQGTVTLRDTSTGEETEVDAATLTLALRQEVRPLLWERAVEMRSLCNCYRPPSLSTPRACVFVRGLLDIVMYIFCCNSRSTSLSEEALSFLTWTESHSHIVFYIRMSRI